MNSYSPSKVAKEWRIIPFSLFQLRRWNWLNENSAEYQVQNDTFHFLVLWVFGFSSFGHFSVIFRSPCFLFILPSGFNLLDEKWKQKLCHTGGTVRQKNVVKWTQTNENVKNADFRVNRKLSENSLMLIQARRRLGGFIDNSTIFF